MAVKARITVYPRPEILDPQGKAITGALGRLGFGQVTDVRAGKSFEIELSKKGRNVEKVLAQMCEQLLANTLIEDYSVELLDGGAKK
ncbi:MAG: phosphoribosylformylglycinamidine synthase subunit PurS [bacterium]|nr:phosphoribosylformylglycinamidine synthase subunit PurS [bacterium]